MLETIGAARRRPPHLAAISAQGFEARALAPEARFKLRLRPADATRLVEVAGFRLDLAINRASTVAGRMTLRLGPDEWLLIASEGDADVLHGQLQSHLAGVVHALVDVSHRHVAVELAGATSPLVLNAGCPLDLHPRAFPIGMATRTLFGKAEVILVRIDDRPGWRLECWRSFAEYVHALLAEAAVEFQAD